MSQRTLVIVGASVRAAAMSAIRAGRQPYGIDLFADRDLRRIATCLRIERDAYPAKLGQLMTTAPAGKWMYTGGLENYPNLIDHWQRTRPLWGIIPPALNRVRDPMCMMQLVPMAECRDQPDATLAPHQWLCKHRSSSGGNGVRDWDGLPISPDHYLQRRLEGESVSAVFVADAGYCRFVGSSVQLVGLPWLHAHPFQYCGSIGPRRLTADEQKQWLHIGEQLNGAMRLQGVLGIDAMLDSDAVTVIEVNPRYTSSVEVFELSSRTAVLHESAMREDVQTVRPVIGKAVYYALADMSFPQHGPWENDLMGPFDPWRLPRYADIPEGGACFKQGDPVITVFSQAATAEACLFHLRELAGELDELFAK